MHRLRVALALRERLYREPYYRLVYGESDGLPGLVLDRYGDVMVAQSGTAGIDRLRGEIEAAIAKVIGAASGWSGRTTRARASSKAWQRSRRQPSASGPRRRRNRRARAGRDFVAPLAQGQKTGWFYDQTANRERLRALPLPPAHACWMCAATWAPGR